MELDKFARDSVTLRHLLHQSQYFLLLDKRVKSLLPVNLHPYFKVACLQQGELILLANNGMAASRLKMMIPAILAEIQSFDEAIVQVKINVQPENPPVKKQKSCYLDDAVLVYFEETANKLAHHPQLAQAIRNLVANQRKS